MLEVLTTLVLPSTLETLIMVSLSTVFAVVLGFPLGIVLATSNPNSPVGIAPHPTLSMVLGKIVNVIRSFPFMILLILIIPFTRAIVGTGIGTAATVVPLSIAASPFVARLAEQGLSEVDPSTVLSARSMGSTNWQIITKVLIPEALPSLVASLVNTLINLIGYSAMAGAVGGGGLGDLAIRYGYHRNRSDVMLLSVVVIILIVELIQQLGNLWVRRIQAKR